MGEEEVVSVEVAMCCSFDPICCSFDPKRTFGNCGIFRRLRQLPIIFCFHLTCKRCAFFFLLSADATSSSCFYIRVKDDAP